MLRFIGYTLRHIIVEPYGRAIFVRLPFIGQAFIGNGQTSFEGWRALKASGEV